MKHLITQILIGLRCNISRHVAIIMMMVLIASQVCMLDCSYALADTPKSTSKIIIAEELPDDEAIGHPCHCP